MDVGKWLRDLGLGQYEAAFRESSIDGQVLPHLTLEDLKEIGVATVGDRRKLLAAVGALVGSTPSAHTPVSQSSAAPSTARESLRRTPPDHGDVLRSRRLDGPRGEARSRGLAQSGERYLDAAGAAVTGTAGTC